MSVSDATRLSYVFKRARNRTFSSIAKASYEELTGVGILAHASWIFADEIPGTPPVGSTPAIKCYVDGIDGALKLTQDVTVGGDRGWYAFDSVRIGDFVPPIFGQDYTIKVYEDNGSGTAKGSRIYDTDPAGMLWDYKNGYLSFENTHSFTTPFWIEGYRYRGNMLSDVSSGGAPIFDDTIASGSVSGGTAWTRQINIGVIESGLFQLVFCDMTSGTVTDSVVELYDADPAGAGVLIYQTPSLDLTSQNHVDPNAWWGEVQTAGQLWVKIHNNGASSAEYDFRTRILGDSSTPFGEP